MYHDVDGWDFCAISHGKGDIDGLSGTCKQRVREKTFARTIHPQNSIEFAECVAAVCPGIIIVYCSKTDVEEIKATLDNSWHIDNGTIYSIPGTWMAYYFRKVNPYTTGFQIITSDASDYAEFLFRTGNSVPKDKAFTFFTETPCV